MKKTKSTATEEIILLEKLTGGDPEKALRNRRVRRAIQTIRHAWSEEPMRFKTDLDELMLNTIRWNWPLRIYSPEQRQAKEKKLRAELERNRPIPKLSNDTPAMEIVKRLRNRITEILIFVGRKTNEIS